MTERRAREGHGGAVSAAPSGVPLAERTEDVLEARLLTEARRYGFRLAVRCNDCGHWLVAAKSVAAHKGPRCRRRLTAGQEVAE
jgi:hypothetical protein